MSATNLEIVRSQDGTSIGHETVGVGDGLLVLGGAWRTSRDYLLFARAMGKSFAVHVIDRRGRGRSGPQGLAYTIDRELEDVAAVQAHTQAKVIFGHSYGGLIALEAARRSTIFTDIVVYEPGVSVAGSIPLGWMRRYRELLATGDRRGAFAVMVRTAGGVRPRNPAPPQCRSGTAPSVIDFAATRRSLTLGDARVGIQVDLPALTTASHQKQPRCAARTARSILLLPVHHALEPAIHSARWLDQRRRSHERPRRRLRFPFPQ
jgi:pimeloyl-ACP methyl ester carboxylesterase